MHTIIANHKLSLKHMLLMFCKLSGGEEREEREERKREKEERDLLTQGLTTCQVLTVHNHVHYSNNPYSGIPIVVNET